MQTVCAARDDAIQHAVQHLQGVHLQGQEVQHAQGDCRGGDLSRTQAIQILLQVANNIFDILFVKFDDFVTVIIRR